MQISRFFVIVFILLGCCSWLVAQNIASVSGNNVTINNGAIEAYISGGELESLNLIGQPDLLANGGYGYFSYNDNEGFYSPSNLPAVVTVNTEDITDFYFEHVDNFIVEMHYVFKKDEPGFYTYFVTRDNGLAFKVISEIRYAVRVDKNIFDYAWTIEREGPMIHPDELNNAVEEIQDATYELADGSIYTKYDWSVYRNIDSLHGIMGNGYGLWNIEASDEYVNGGPNMQDLTLHGTHTTPILLTSFHTSHYGNVAVALKDEYLEWSKIWGPAFTYINTGTNSEIIEDAQQKAAEKKSEWPYNWLDNPLYPLERGTLSGTLNMMGQGEVDSAMVLLSKPPASWYADGADWQQQPYDYIFWDEADEFGNFEIEKIRPGTYDLYAYTQKGKLVEQLKIEAVQITEGGNSLGMVDWDNNDRRHTIFQLGQADHKSGEFALADLPRSYGRWQDTPDNLDYTVGISDDRTDWYYCQRENTEWNIQFDVNNLDSIFDPVLRIGFAGADVSPHLDAILNGEEIGYFRLGDDSSIRRSSLTGGKFEEIRFEFDENILVDGSNTLSLNCYGSDIEFKGLMYDAILMEANLGTPVTTISNPNNLEQNYQVYGIQRQILLTSSRFEEATVRVYTLGGAQLVHQGKITYGKNYIPINHAGGYVVQVIDEQEFFSKKIILF